MPAGQGLPWAEQEARQYGDVVSFLAKVEQQSRAATAGDARQPLELEALARLERQHPGLPADYVAYLREMGWGSFLRCRYTIYRELLPLADRLGQQAADCVPEIVLCFGDNLHGDLGGFLPEHGWAIVEVSGLDLSLHEPGQTFGEFIRERMGMDEE